MEQAKRKLQRIGPVLKAKNSEMEKEAAELFSIRMEKEQLVAELLERKNTYIRGVDQLNQVRSNGSFSQLQFLEQGLDFLKTKWTESFNGVNQIEILERSQMNLVMLAQKNLKAVEKLEIKYQDDFSLKRMREEQKTQDDQSIERRFFKLNQN